MNRFIAAWKVISGQFNAIPKDKHIHNPSTKKSFNNKPIYTDFNFSDPCAVAFGCIEYHTSLQISGGRIIGGTIIYNLYTMECDHNIRGCRIDADFGTITIANTVDLGMTLAPYKKRVENWLIGNGSYESLIAHDFSLNPDFTRLPEDLQNLILNKASFNLNKVLKGENNDTKAEDR